MRKETRAGGRGRSSELFPCKTKTTTAHISYKRLIIKTFIMSYTELYSYFPRDSWIPKPASSLGSFWKVGWKNTEPAVRGRKQTETGNSGDMIQELKLELWRGDALSSHCTKLEHATLVIYLAKAFELFFLFFIFNLSNHNHNPVKRLRTFNAILVTPSLVSVLLKVSVESG